MTVPTLDASAVTTIKGGWIELDDQCVLSFRGTAARAFLGRQLTCDINVLTAETPQFGALLTPKGRVLSLLRLFERTPDQVAAIVPSELAEQLAQRLRMFVMRDDVTIEVDVQQGVFGLWGDCVTSPGSSVAQATDPAVIHLADHPSLAMLIGPSTALRSAFGKHARMRGDMAQWQYMNIAAGLPQVALATREAFIPQMINLDRLGGVSFTKGCYPGQEIVARTQHLGRIKRRMFITRATDGDALEAAHAGDIIVGPEGEDIGGRVVSVGRAEHDTLLLAVLPLNSDAAPKPMHLHNASGPALEVLPPPYSLTDSPASS